MERYMEIIKPKMSLNSRQRSWGCLSRVNHFSTEIKVFVVKKMYKEKQKAIPGIGNDKSKAQQLEELSIPWNYQNLGNEGRAGWPDLG